MKQSSIKRLAAATVVASVILTGVLAPSTATFASGGASGNGGNGNGGSVKGGGSTDSSGVVVTLNPQVSSYNGSVPKGSVTLGYAADGSAQSMSFSLSNIKVPDGTVLPVRVILGKTETVFTYYATTAIVYTEVDGTITISHSSSSLTLSKLKGDLIPDFPAPAGAGTTEISILSPDGSTVLLDGIVGSFHL